MKSTIIVAAAMGAGMSCIAVLIVFWWYARSNGWYVPLYFNRYNEALFEGILLHTILVFSLVVSLVMLVRHTRRS